MNSGEFGGGGWVGEGLPLVERERGRPRLPSLQLSTPPTGPQSSKDQVQSLI